MSLCTCPPDALCPRCYGRELASKLGQARVQGAVWAEKVARDPKHRGHAAWPQDERALAMAAGKIAQLTADPRLRGELAAACVAGAAAWWADRPARYRV